jgi:hypothetical protein
VVDLTTPERKPEAKRRQVEVVVLDDSGPGGSQAETVVRETVISAPPPPRPPPPLAPAVRVRLKECKFGQRCRKLNDPFHCQRFAHNSLPSMMPETLAVPPNLFGGGAHGHQRYMQERRQKLEREEQLLVEAIAKSLEEERAAAERRKLREAQDAEYQRSVREDRKAYNREKAKKRQRLEDIEAIPIVDEEKEEEVEEVMEESVKDITSSSTTYQLLEDEPDASEACVTVTFSLPDASRIARRFRGEASTEQLYSFIHHHSAADMSTAFVLLQLRSGVVSRINLTIAEVARNDSRILLFVQQSE